MAKIEISCNLLSYQKTELKFSLKNWGLRVNCEPVSNLYREDQQRQIIQIASPPVSYDGFNGHLGKSYSSI